ncbi:hypothetical protein Ancab_019429 [Ancistrocladus abbreviatus]
MLKLCSMASHGYPPGLVFHHEKDLGRVSKDCQLLLPAQLRQEIIRPATLYLRLYQQYEPWDPRSRVLGSNRFVNIDSSVGEPVLMNVQDSVLLGSGIAKKLAEREMLLQFLVSGSSGIDKDRLDVLLLFDLMRLEAAKLHSQLQCAADFGSDNYAGLRHSVFFPSGNSHFLEPRHNFVHDFLLHSAVSINPDGQIVIRDATVEMRDLVSVLAEFYLARESTWKQKLIVPHFRWPNTVEGHADIYGSRLTSEIPIAAPMKSPETIELKTALKKKKKKAGKKRDPYKQNYSHACETLLTLTTDKKRNRKTIMNSLKKSGPELPQLLTQFAASIAGTGLAVLSFVIHKMACGKVPFSSTRLVTTGFGFGLLWLSWAVNKLRDTIVLITKNSGKGFTEEEMVKMVDKSVNDIFFRTATLMAVTALWFA